MMKASFLFLFFILGFFSQAQWNENNTENTQISHSEFTSHFLTSAVTDEGDFYIIYNPIQTTDLQVQFLDKNGYVQLGENGVNIENVNVNVFNRAATLLVDDVGNAYLSYTGTDDMGYVVKLNSEGEQLWASGGINIGNASDISITYIAEENNIFVRWLFDGNLYINKISYEGESIWDEPLVITSPIAEHSLTDAGDILINNDDFFIFYKVQTSIAGADLYAQKFAISGDVVWDEEVKVSDKSLDYYNPKFKLDTQGNVFCVISNEFFIESDGVIRGIIQRLNNDGSLPWGNTGVYIRDLGEPMPREDFNIQIEIDESNGVIWIPFSNTDTIFNDSQLLYIQKLNLLTGERLFGQSQPIFDDTNKRRPIGIGLYNNFPAIGYVEGNLQYGEVKIGFTILNQNGNITTTDEYLYFNASFSNKRPTFSLFIDEPETAEATAIWAEDREGENNYNLFAHKLDMESILSTTEFFDENKVLVYPNPVNDFLFISTENSEILKIELLNIEGKKLSDYNNSVISFKEFPAGIYVVKISLTNGEVVTKKVIKK